jgi:hypothetical protein
MTRPAALQAAGSLLCKCRITAFEVPFGDIHITALANPELLAYS